MRIVIMGASRVAAALVALLENEGHKVVVIDIDPDGFNRLPQNYQGEKVLGSGTELDVYKKINLGPDDGFVAATNSENVNISAVRMVKDNFKCARTAKLLFDPLRAKAFNEVEKGIICPILDAARQCQKIMIG